MFQDRKILPLVAPGLRLHQEQRCCVLISETVSGPCPTSQRGDYKWGAHRPLDDNTVPGWVDFDRGTQRAIETGLWSRARSHLITHAKAYITNTIALKFVNLKGSPAVSIPLSYCWHWRQKPSLPTLSCSQPVDNCILPAHNTVRTSFPLWG